MAKQFVKTAHEAHDAASARQLYDAWSETYEAEVSHLQYATPSRCAEALAAYTEDQLAPILDFGCGTGLSGLALKIAGFATIDGVDMSPDMIGAASRKRLYRTLHQVEAGCKLPFAPGTYSAMAAVVVIGGGAAPASTLYVLMKALVRGGKLVFSLNDHALQDPSNEACLNEWLDCGAARLLFKEYGPHLPGIHLKANVYVIEKL